MNKIAFVYEFGEETWSTPQSLITEFKKRHWDVNRFHLSKMDRFDKQSLIDFKSDIVLVMDWRGIDISNDLKSILKNNGSFLIRENGDTCQNYLNHLPCCHRYDFLITPDYPSTQNYIKAGFNCEWIPHWADTNIQYPMEIDPEYVAVTTRGYGNSQVLDIITKWGEGSIGNKNGMDGLEHTTFLNSGLMIIQNSRYGELTRRIPEGMVCGKLVITDRLKAYRKLNDLYEENKEIVLYDTVEELAEKINYYSENIEERESIAKAGLKKTLENYTQIQVVDKIIKIWKNSL